MSEREGEGYQGWANQETWLANLWLTNDEATYNAAQGVIADAGDPYRGADDLREWVEAQNPLASQASLFNDLLTLAIAHINFDEVARALGPQEWGRGGEGV